MAYEVVCTKEYLDVGLCVKRDENSKPTRVLARLFPYSSTTEYGTPEYGGVELLDWINTGVFMSPKEWADISYNKPTSQILRELGIEKNIKEEKSEHMTTVRQVVDDKAFEKKYNIEWHLGNGELRTTSAVMTSIENGYIFFRYPSGGIFMVKDEAIRSLECLE